MTRFARAKGSKASNERAPEDATPWAVMKEQLQRAKDDAEHERLREQAEKQRLENYEKFLQERKSAKRKSTWCEFPGETPEQPAKQRKQNKSPHPGENDTPTDDGLVKNKKKKKSKNNASQNENHELGTDTIDSSETAVLNKKAKKKSGKQHADSENAEMAQVEVGNKTKKNKKTQIDRNSEDVVQSEEVNRGFSEIENNDEQQKTKKKKKNKNKTNIQIDPSLQADSKLSKAKDNSDIEKGKSSGSRNETVSTPKQKKKNKFEKGTHARRKTESDRSFELIINGRAVELVRYDGFPVMRKDADRLEELKRNMMTKGIPKSEVQRTMKLERRRAEKALARLKRDVCYNCRKGGHNLSDCPELRDRLEPRGEAGPEGPADGVCFKCGSTEHRAFDCKVQRSQDYKFASCFICKEQGHIARQCPDNPRGLYPNGGGCKLCGDVTHLRKDCPTTSTEKVEASVRLESLASSDAVEGIGQRAAAAAVAKKKTKKVTF